MQQEALNDQKQPSPAPRRPPVLLGLVSAILLLTLLAVCGISQLALWLVMPHATSYPRSVLAIGEADYGPWESGPRLPAYNPEALLADDATPGLPISGIQPWNDTVPVAVIGGFSTPTPTLPPLPPSLLPGRSPTPTSTPVIVAVLSPTSIVSLPTTPATPIPAAALLAAPPVQRVPSATPTPPASGNLFPTATRQPTHTSTAPATRQPTHTSTATATRRPTRTATATATRQPTYTSTATNVPTATPTLTTEPTAMPTATHKPTATPTDVPRIDLTATPTATTVPTATATTTAVPTATATATAVPTATATTTAVPTATATTTAVPTATATTTAVPTATATTTAVPTATATTTAVPTATPTNVPEPVLARFGANHFSVDEDVGIVDIPVSLSTTFAQTIQVNYSVTGGSATRAADYDLPDGMLTFEPGATRQTIRLTIIDDTLDEPDETIELTLSSAVNAVLSGTNPLIVTINDNDDPPALSINNVSVIEGNPPDTVNATFTVSLSTASGKPVMVDYATQDGTATVADNDYQPRSGTLTFAPGQTVTTISVPVIGDDRDEENETFFVNLSNPINATLAVAQGVATIVNDDAVTISIDTVTELEGTGGETTPFVFTVSLSNPSTREITVDYATEDGTATVADNDYQPQSGTLTFALGQTVKTISVPVIGDDRDEENETFFVNLSNPINATLAVAQGVATIVNDDTPPALTINDVTQKEGTGSTPTPFVFTVSLDRASGKTVTVNYATRDGTATLNTNDYVNTSGTLTFDPGVTTRTITVPVIADNLDEDDETFFVNLTNPVNASIAVAQGVGTIVNDDAATISINNVTRLEGTGIDPTPFVFTVSLSNPSTREISVDYATEDGTATVADNDYQPQSGTLTFAPGQTVTTISVPVIGDDRDEENETFFVNLTNPMNATLAVAQGIGTIIDDDGSPTLFIDNVTVIEGNPPSTVHATFIVRLSSISGKTVTVDYATADGTATAGSDYVHTSGTLTFAPGTTTRTITVPVIADNVDEDAETFFVNLTNPVNASIAVAQGVGTIVNDDAVTIGIDTVTQAEGTGGATTPFVFTVSLSNPSTREITVEYATADGTATAGSDYMSTSGTLTFAPGVTTHTISVPVIADDLDENDETFFVNLTNPVNATLAVAQGMGTIENDDAVTISIDTVTQAEGTGGATTPFVFTVSLSNPSTREITVEYATADGTATAGSDYMSTSGTLTFAPGVTTHTISVPVIADDLDENDETFFVNLTNPVNASIAVAQGVGTIENDDVAPTVFFSYETLTVNEGDGTVFVFACLSAPSGRTITVDYAVTGGSATLGNDYVLNGTTLTFNPGDLSRAFTIDIIDDTLAEATETVELALSNPQNATLGTPATFTLSIEDNEPNVQFRHANYSVDENADSVEIEAVLSHASSAEITVDYVTEDGPDPSATAGVDYMTTSGTLTFAPGQTSRTFSVRILDDKIGEPNERIRLRLHNPNQTVRLGTRDTAILTIMDDEPRIRFSTTSYTVHEDAETATIEVVLSTVYDQSVQVEYYTGDGPNPGATAGLDYNATSGTLTFAPGQTSHTFTVTILDDPIGEPDERIRLRLRRPAHIPAETWNAYLGTPNNVLLTILDDEPRASFRFSSTYPGNVSENIGTATVEVVLSKPYHEEITVDYYTEDGPNPGATAGLDYVAASGTLTFAPGVTSQTFNITILDDDIPELNERIRLHLHNPSPNASVGEPVNLTILDDEPRLQFSSDSYSVQEDAGTATITVVRTGRTDLPVTVDYATSDDTATAGSDYVATSGTLYFAPGVTSQTFTVPIIDDLLNEPDERVRLTLSNPGANARLGAPAQATLTIRDNDPLPTISFDAASYSVNEGEGQISIPVTLNTPSSRTVQVQYATRNGTATAGSDYVQKSGTLTFNPGQTNRTITIRIINDTISETDETFYIDLMNFNNATPGAIITTQMTIIDND